MTIWTVGHSTQSAQDFVRLLQAHRIEAIADVRRFPGSRRYPQFGQDNLRRDLAGVGIAYVHFEALGGRRTPRPDSPNTRWRNAAFRGYADYMESCDFQAAFAELKELAIRRRTAMLCAEAVWWRCHRGLISDLLKQQGTSVLHITSAAKAQEHPYTSAARVTPGGLIYADTPALLFDLRKTAT